MVQFLVHPCLMLADHPGVLSRIERSLAPPPIWRDSCDAICNMASTDLRPVSTEAHSLRDNSGQTMPEASSDFLLCTGGFPVLGSTWPRKILKFRRGLLVLGTVSASMPCKAVNTFCLVLVSAPTRERCAQRSMDCGVDACT